MFREEEKVAQALQSAGIEFKREHRVTFDCWDDTWASIDFIIVQAGVVFVLEVDEDQHEWYGTICEVSRMMKVYAALIADGNTLPVVIIRYNPHAFRVNGQLQKVVSRDRITTLVHFIQFYRPVNNLQIQYMYYNCTREDNHLKLNVFDSSMYHDEIKACCCPPIM